jgi:hypothetical protein
MILNSAFGWRETSDFTAEAAEIAEVRRAESDIY